MVQRALHESNEKKAELFKKLQRRKSFSEKMHRQGMTIDYVAEDDYLTITFGEPSESVSLPSKCPSQRDLPARKVGR